MTETLVDSRVTVRLFIGCAITPELRSHLGHSLAWKEAAILRSSDPHQLIDTNFHNKPYIGLYGDEQLLSLPQIRRLQQTIRDQLREYCPKLIGIDKLSIYVFPQIFVT